MARYDHLPIWKTALDLALAVESAVAGIVIVCEFVHAVDGRTRRMLATLFSISSAHAFNWPYAAGGGTPKLLSDTQAVTHATWLHSFHLTRVSL